MVLYLTLLFFCIFHLVSPVCAQSLFETSESGQENSSSINIEAPGFIRSNIYIGENITSNKFEYKQTMAEFAIQPRIRDNNYGSAFADIRLNNYDFTFREAYIDAYFNNINIKAGKQIVVWGKADGINPTNVITPSDMSVFSPDEDETRSANFLLRSFYNLSPFRVEFIWVPVYGETTLPDFDLPSSINFNGTSYPEHILSNSSAALKFHYGSASIDASVSYYDGWSVTPGLKFVSYSEQVLSIDLTSYRTRSIGADFSSSLFSPYGIRGEIAYKRPDHPGFNEYTPKPELYYVIGTDKEFMNGNLSVIFQYIGKYVFNRTSPSVSNTDPVQTVMTSLIQKNMIVSGQTKKWSHSLSLRPSYMMLNETMSVEALVMFNFSTKELLLKPELSYNISDMMSFAAGFDYFRGNEETLFGLISKTKSAFYAELKLSFI